jgi:hypothetical protein
MDAANRADPFIFISSVTDDTPQRIALSAMESHETDPRHAMKNG